MDFSDAIKTNPQLLTVSSKRAEMWKAVSAVENEDVSVFDVESLRIYIHGQSAEIFSSSIWRVEEAQDDGEVR